MKINLWRYKTHGNICFIDREITELGMWGRDISPVYFNVGGSWSISWSVPLRDLHEKTSNLSQKR